MKTHARYLDWGIMFGEGHYVAFNIKHYSIYAGTLSRLVHEIDRLEGRYE
jgi:hypothetical protein